MKKALLICVLVLAALLFCACGNDAAKEELPVYEYTDVYVRFMEPCASGYLMQKNVPQTEAGGHLYRFEPSIPEERRSEFIGEQEKLCALLDRNGISTDGLCFFVLEDYPNRTECNNGTAYFGLGNAKSWEQVLTTVQLALGDYTNYGYLYALSDRLAEELSWRRDEIAETDAELSDDSLLNLVYPCFDENYTAQEDIAVCKSLSVELLAASEDPWSEESFLQTIRNRAAETGIDLQPTYIGFAYNGKSCPLKVRTRYLEVFKTDEFTENSSYTAGYYSEDFFSSPGSMIRAFSFLDENLNKLSETFGVEDPSLLPVFMRDYAANTPYFEAGGIYRQDKDGGYVISLDLTNLPHEYVHYLYYLSGGTADPGYKSWINEVAACYYTYPRLYELSHIDYENSHQLSLVKKTIGEPYDEPTDYIRLIRTLFRNNDNEYPYKYYVITAYDLREAFGEYFVRTYGEECFIEWLKAPSKVKKLTGRTVDEILDDFCADLDDPKNDKLLVGAFEG